MSATAPATGIRRWTRDRVQTFEEEKWNALSAGYGLVAAMGCGVVLTMEARKIESPVLFWAVAVFCFCFCLMNLASMLYHSAGPGTVEKHRLLILDHSAILFLIAGTYTPLALGVSTDLSHWILVVLQWMLALAGVWLLIRNRPAYRKISTVLYLAMGWMGVVVTPGIFSALPTPSFAWLLAGGIFYTSGVVFYTFKQIRFFHLVWHGFVIAGGISHAAAIFFLLRLGVDSRLSG